LVAVGQMDLFKHILPLHFCITSAIPVCIFHTKGG